MDIGSKIAIMGIFSALTMLTCFTYTDKPTSSIVETRREHLVFEAEGCRVYQVRMQDKDGLRHIYIAVPHPDKHGRYTTPYPRCQVTAH